MHHKDTLAKPKLTLRNKISLIILGLFFCIILLEIGLRLGGFIFISLQERGNLVSIRQKGTYRIMCLGESTTARLAANSYPSQLKKILNQRNIGVRFSVINKGAVGINSSYILLHLDENLDIYQPDMVMVMMGVNDRAIKYYEGIPHANDILFNKSRAYRLAMIIWKCTVNKIKANVPCNTVNENIDTKSITSSPGMERIRYDSVNEQAYIESGRCYGKQGDYMQAEKFFKKAIELNPRSEPACIGLGWCYNHQAEFSLAEKFFKKAIELNPHSDQAYSQLGWCYINQDKFFLAEIAFKKAIELNPKNEDVYIEMGWLYSHQGRYAQAEELFKEAIKANPRNTWSYFNLGWCYSYQDKFGQAEEAFKKSLELNPQNDRACGSLATLYMRTGKDKEAQEYAQKTNLLRSQYYNPATYRNYQRLKTVLDKRGIKLACVQYPMRNIEPLKRIFQGQEGVIFVDNENVFKEAVSKDGYKEYFVDMFGGDFGHCTPKGNKLLAENIANIVLKEVFGK